MGCLIIGLYVLGFIFFFCIAMAAWSDGEYWQSVASYIISLFVLPISFYNSKYMKKYRENYEKEMAKRKTISLVQHTTIKQILETVYLLETTKKYDVFTSRLEFLFELLKVYQAALEAGNIDNTIKKGLELYMGLYYNREITTCQIHVLEDPKKYVTKEFIAELYVSFFSRYSRQLKDEQLSLKTQKAKDKRTDQLIECSIKIKDQLKEINMESYIIQINEIINTFNKVKIL